MNQAEMLVKFARESDFDCFLLAGRYTVIGHAGLKELLPLCGVERNISVIIGGPFNSGILSEGVGGCDRGRY
jgi:D-threo-aldose 1-dehydrogenase